MLPSALELSSDAGLVACGLLTLNLLLGILLGVRYNPWMRWPRRRINYFRIHNWTGYTALAIAVLHPVLALFSTTVHFRVIDIVVPVDSPEQPLVNTLGAAGLYVLAVVVGTSYVRRRLTRRTWKRIHYAAYAAAILFFAHGLFSDPSVEGKPIDWLDAEKVFVEGCVLAVAGASAYRWRWALRHRRWAAPHPAR